ncbi:MAG: hypothetical protein K6E47_09960 [Lachnospiraceae bacterium]|nr:hypothetical protein [Lachnospiraceae bacterium]
MKKSDRIIRKINRNINLFTWFCAFISFFCTLISVINLFDSYKTYRVEPYNREALDEDAFMCEMFLLREESFKDLSDDKKLHALQTLSDNETNRAGGNNYPKVVIRSLPDAYGQYSFKTNEIEIDDCFFHNATSRELVCVCLHEWHHWYTHQLSNAYLELPKEYQDMEAFAQYRIYSYEYQNYVRAEDDINLYRQQSVEADARSYAKRATDGYFALIEQYYNSIENSC